MKPTKLEWEDVTQFEEVKGYGQHIWRDEDKYYLVLEEGTVASWLVVYELPNDLFTLLDSGERTLSEVSWKIKYDSWPPSEEEKNEIRRARKKPIVLISNRNNQSLFSNKELEILIPKAEQQWIESMGKLPDDYVSPLK